MTRVLVAALIGLVVGLPTAADDPPKKLSPEERTELDAKRKVLNAAAAEHFRRRRLPEAAEAYEKVVEIARQLYPLATHPDGHPVLAMSLDNLAAVYEAQGRLGRAEAS